jgi:hypothetical protein
MIQQVWRNLLTQDLETPLAARDDLDEVIAVLVKSRIDPQKFGGNLIALLSSGMGDLFGVAMGAPSCTPSIRQFTSVLNRPPNVPLWLIAGFPDVLCWFNEKLRDAGNAHEETTARLFGIDLASPQGTKDRRSDMRPPPIPRSHFENSDGTLRARFYGNLVSNYAKETGRSLEAAVEEGTESDLYMGEDLLQMAGEESNFTLIASMTTKYYLELKRTHGCCFADETSLLAMAGMLDASRYILDTRQINPSQIVQLARETVAMHDRLLQFLVRFEAVLLSLDNPGHPPHDVRSACDDQATAIRGAIQRTMDSYRGEPMIAMAVKAAMSAPQFATWRRIAGVESPSLLATPERKTEQYYLEKSEQTRVAVCMALHRHHMLYTELVWTEKATGKETLAEPAGDATGRLRYLPCPGLTAQEIAINLEQPPWIVQSHLNTLLKSNTVEAVTKGIWRWRKTYYKLTSP